MGRPVIGLIGQIFGRLTVLKLSHMNTRKQAVWSCRCDCGKESVVDSWNLRRGQTKSCGCLEREGLMARNTTHGMSGTRTYRSWEQMHRRCSSLCDKKDIKYYFGRGIKVCKRWEKFENFFVDMGERPEGKTLDRKSSDGNYEPSNCKWSTPKEQANNRRDNKPKER